MTSKKGGVAILVQRGIQYRELYLSNLQSLEAIKYASSYRRMATYQGYQLTSPQAGLFYEYLEYIFGLSSSVLLTGDLNCKHADWNDNCSEKWGTLS
jgi:hypothetical protein